MTAVADGNVKDNASVEDKTNVREEDYPFPTDIYNISPDVLDITTFEQILEMDDDEDERDFSRAIVFGFFDQAITTFKQMDDLIINKDLDQLSSLGHFLKGSSATLGLSKLKDSCEKIQHFGASKDETGTREVNDKELCLKRIKDTLETMKEEYREVEKCLKGFYGGPANST